jgi:hypothetical protein
MQKPFAPQRHLGQFPAQINRENISKNRDFFKPEQGKTAKSSRNCINQLILGHLGHLGHLGFLYERSEQFNELRGVRYSV